MQKAMQSQRIMQNVMRDQNPFDTIGAAALIFPSGYGRDVQRNSDSELAFVSPVLSVPH